MISITPPQTKDYAPKTQPIASVRLLVQVRDNAAAAAPTLGIQLALSDANGKQIAIDAGSIPPMTPAETSAFLDGLTEELETRLAPYLARAYGLSGKSTASAASKAATPATKGAK